MSSKFDVLQSLTPTQVRDAWVTQGALTADALRATYNAGLIYSISQTCNLKNFLIFCEEDYYGIIDWATFSYNDLGQLIDNSFIISPYFKEVATAADIIAITDPISNQYNPFIQNVTADKLIISDRELELILLEVGVPFITFEELEYPKEKIIDLMIRPAVQEYWRWFPKIVKQQFPQVNNNIFTYPVPTWAYGAVRVFVIQGAGGTVTNPLLRYFDEVIWQSNNDWALGGTKRAPGMVNNPLTGAMMFDRAVRQGMMNYSQRIHFEIKLNDDGTRVLTGYSNKIGALEIHWTCESMRFSDIQYVRQNEVRRLATAKVLRGLGMLRSQIKTDLPGQLDFSNFLNRAEAIEQDITKTWQEASKIVLIRS